MPKLNDTTYYADWFKAWQAKLYGGRKPTAGELATVHALGYRPGKQALFAAMCMRDDGCTRPECMLVCGAPQFNKTFGQGGTVGVGYFKRLPHAPRNGHVVYKIELTAKGKAKAEAKPATVDATPAKAKAKAKGKAKAPRKPKAVPQVPAVTEPVTVPQVTEPATDRPQA